MLVTLSGIVTLVRLVQLRGTPYVADAGDAVADRDAGQAGAAMRTHSVPMLVTLSGIVTLVRLVQSAERPIPDAGDAVGDRDAGQAGAVTERLSPMLVTLLGIVTLVRLVQSENAESPMLVTGRPSIVLGMVTSPPGPVYPVMVIVPLLVV